jgi:hypothetical protein
MTARKAILSLTILAALVASHFSQRALNRDRETLGLTRTAIISNAPPILAFTTVALGGFRGLIANTLWIRTTELQEDGKYFEAVQLADWITKLQPHFTTVWVHQAWNMAYNISVKFPEPEDRWLWVQRGIELLRDEGMRYNPHEVMMYRELGWIFQHKMGAYLDDAHLTYKARWAQRMEEVIPGGRPDYATLLAPVTAESSNRVAAMIGRYKLIPAVMKEVDDKYGPLEWRLPEAHAVYWGYRGLAECKKETDRAPLRRVVFQSMLTTFQRGRLFTNIASRSIELGPNLNIVGNTSRAYEDMIAADDKMGDHFAKGHKNFLRDAVYFLYTANREREAAQWWEYCKKKYGNELGDQATMSLEQFAIARVSEDANETSPDRIKAVITGLLTQGFVALANGDEDRGDSMLRLATKVHSNYQQRTSGKSMQQRIPIAPLNDYKMEILRDMLAPSEEVNPEFQATLRTRLNLPASFGIPTTNSAPAQSKGPMIPFRR